MKLSGGIFGASACIRTRYLLNAIQSPDRWRQRAGLFLAWVWFIVSGVNDQFNGRAV